MPCGATQDRRVMVERSDRMWSTGEGNGKPLQFSCLENPMNSEVKSLSRAQPFETPWTVACTKLFRPWDFLSKSTGVGCHFLLQRIFLMQGSNPGLLYCRQTLYHLSHQVRLEISGEIAEERMKGWSKSKNNTQLWM